MTLLLRSTILPLLAGALLLAIETHRVTKGAAPDQAQHCIELLSTEDGVQFAALEVQFRKPAPTLLVLATTPEKSLGDPDYLQCGTILSRQGFLCVSLELPCHGADHRANEPAELAGWAHRLDHGEELVKDFVERAMSVLDHLVATGAADPERIAVCGVSRGGFMAFHLAAQDPRVRTVVAMAPVTRLAYLTEFHQMQHPERADALSVASLADRLADRKVWIAIGDRDLRVGTDEAIAFARRLSASAVQQSLPPPVDLHVVAQPLGHATPPGAAEQSAMWIAKRFAEQ